MDVKTHIQIPLAYISLTDKGREVSLRAGGKWKVCGNCSKEKCVEIVQRIMLWRSTELNKIIIELQ